MMGPISPRPWWPDMEKPCGHQVFQKWSDGRVYRWLFHLQVENISFFTFFFLCVVASAGTFRTMLNGDNQSRHRHLVSTFSRNASLGITGSFQSEVSCSYSGLDIFPLIPCFFLSILSLLLQGETDADSSGSVFHI